MEYLNFAKDLARAAGEVLKHYAARDKQVMLKGRANLVTIADKESEALVIDMIRKRYPTHGIIAEESGASGGGEDSRWIIDPLDGTTNFAHQYPFYSVSIGFEQNGVVQCGVVYDPHRDELYSGAIGMGSYCNDERLHVSETPDLAGSLLTTGFPYNFRQNIDVAIAQFRGFMVECQAVRRGGSAALDLCYVASGRCDGFWELNLQAWDTAAGRVIAEEAGGKITDFAGSPFSIYGKQIVASNSKIHQEMLNVLSAHREMGI